MSNKKPVSGLTLDVSLPRQPSSSFRKAIGASEAATGSLPLTHITDGYRFRSVIQTNSLDPTYCRVYEKPLLYFFYGRPSYRANQQAQSSSIEAYAPICFIIDPIFDFEIAGIYPFDSGAFHRQLLEGAFHHAMIKEDFALDTDFTTPRRLVRLFFGDMDRYYMNRPRTDVSIPPMDYEVASYYGLIKDELKNDYDERISAIEIQTEKSMPLSDSVLAIIIPDNFLVSQPVVDFIQKLNIEAIPYDYISRLRPEQYTSQIYSLVRAYYRKKGFL